MGHHNEFVAVTEDFLSFKSLRAKLFKFARCCTDNSSMFAISLLNSHIYKIVNAKIKRLTKIGLFSGPCGNCGQHWTFLRKFTRSHYWFVDWNIKYIDYAASQDWVSGQPDTFFLSGSGIFPEYFLEQGSGSSTFQDPDPVHEWHIPDPVSSF